MKRALILFVCLLPALASAQRFDGQPTSTTQASSIGNFYVPLPNSNIHFCSHPANGTPCTNYAQTYTDSTLGTPCSTATQVVQNGTTSCTANSDGMGNWGVWASPGQYDYTITVNGTSYGPYTTIIPLSTTASSIWTGQQTFNGGAVSTALNIGTRYVGSLFAGDLGTQANTQAAILSAAGGGELVISPPASLSYSTGIVLPSNVRLHGQSTATTIVFTGTGNAISASSVSNVEIDHLTISNGSNQTGTFIAGQNVIRLDNVSGFAIHDLRIPATAGAYSVFSYNGSNGQIYGNDIGPTTYCGVCLGVGNNGIRVIGNSIHDITTTAAGVGYGISAATIAETSGQTQNYSNDVIIANNTIKNVPLWEALDIHGGTNITFKDNYVENAFVCILTALNSVGLHAPGAPSMRGIHIEGNTCKQGTATLNGRGIVVGGDNQNFYANDVWVQGNYLTGYGAGSTASASTLGALDVRSVNNVSMKDNHFWNYSQQAVYMQDVHGSDISGNYCYDMIDHFPASVTGSCIFPNTGNWDITVENNHLTPSALATSPYYFLRTGNVANNIKLGRNYIGLAQTGDYFAIGTNLYFATAPTTANSLMLKNGDPIFDQLGRIGWYASSGRGFWGLSTLTITTANITNGSFTLNGFSGGSGSTTWYHWLPPYANITIAGAGPAGAPLNAMILVDDGTNVTLDTAASTTVTGANVTYQVPTIVSANQYLNEWETRSLPSPVQGLQWVFDYPNAAYTNGSAFGFEFGTNNGGFYGTYNVRQTTRNTDSWTSTNAAQPNYLLDVNNAGLSLWYAAAGTSPATKATFFGASPAWQCTNLGCLWGTGLAVPNSSFVMQNVGTFTTGASPYTAAVSSTFHITSSSHCVVNAADATSAAYTSVSVAPGTNQIVLTYTGTSGHPVWFECSAL